ncbi:hypothetical protein ABBQ38_011273 [Trebouxia sp. C0009 RCD-2024]
MSVMCLLIYGRLLSSCGQHPLSAISARITLPTGVVDVFGGNGESENEQPFWDFAELLGWAYQAYCPLVYSRCPAKSTDPTLLMHLSYLYLHGNLLVGTLPESWSTLTNLTDMDVSSNRLDGTLPSAWAGLTQSLSLDMTCNMLTGTLPESWSNFTSLSSLSVSNNSISGTLPSSWSALTKGRYQRRGVTSAVWLL